jgi:hypothetical protein
MNKISKLNIVYFLLFFGLIARILAFIYHSDSNIDNEWGILLQNFTSSGIFGYNVAVNEYFAIPKIAEFGERVLPSVFMPPLYFYFIYVINIISFYLLNTIDLIILIQIFLSLISIIIFNKILKSQKEKNSLRVYLVSIFAFFPINIYATSQISSITLQVFLILFFLFYLSKLTMNFKIKDLIFFSFFSSMLILIRGEFIFFYFFSLFYFFFFFKKNIKAIIISLIISLILITPYLYRNYKSFNTVTLTKSFGYNLLKGNNPEFKVEGNSSFIEEKFQRKDLKIKTNNKYEIELDNFYKNKAIDYIKSDPLKYVKFFFYKVISFLIFDINSSYPHYFNVFHIVPKIIIAISSLIGAFLSLRKKGFYQFLSIYYFLNIFLFSIFFILPRYSLILLPVQLLLSIESIKVLRRKLMN